MSLKAACAIILSSTLVIATQLQAAELKTQKQRLSYSLGLQGGQQMKGEGIDLDVDAFAEGMRDIFSGSEPQLSIEDIQSSFTAFQEQRMQEIKAAASKNITEGKTFLESNKGEAGVTVLPSGLQYKVINAGKGEKPKATDTVVVHYRGTLIDGTEFDSSYSRGAPATFPVNGVIQGWQEALQLMTVGAKWQLVIPADLAYGERGTGGNIGPNATLIFDVELLEIKG